MSIPITNPKILSLAPEWARFRGFSLLFQNPADAPGRTLYRELEEARAALNAAGPQIPGLCMLPPAAFHVTVWDGVNDGNLAQVPPKHRREWSAFLDSLPRPDLPSGLFREVAAAELVACPDWNLRLRGAQVENWGNISIVLRLEPADANAAGRLHRLVEARTRLTDAFAARFGVRPHPDYTPHVTLGYFANDQVAAQSGAAIARWNAVILDRLAGSPIFFPRVQPSVFTDMASFGRNPHPSRFT